MVMVAYFVGVFLKDRNLSIVVEIRLVINLQKLRSHNLKKGFFFEIHFS
jgi:hypothetical protein